jgi:hypothetical protein
MKVVNRNLNAEHTRFLVTVRLTYKMHEKGNKKTITMPVYAPNVHMAEEKIKAKIKTWKAVKKSEILFIENTSTGRIK